MGQLAPPRVALVVDNPLRDLDGLALLAWELARRGAVAYLIPMYRQGFDVPALQPDVVLANYVRPNNRDLLLLYKSLGIRVAVLDTEGAAGKSAEHFASMVAPMGCADYVDLYCVWGADQYAAFRAAGVVDPDRLRLTGCPRFDFCAQPWRTALPTVGARDFVLVNTNFPTVNPRFSTGEGHELRAMVATGFSEEFARRFIDDARKAQRGMIKAVAELARRFPAVHFVLRPHPFERADPYRAIDHPNFEVRQEGSVLQWLAASRLLVHQNCSTAVEAVMLGVEPLSLEWFNTPALYLEGPTSVSQNIPSLEGLIERVAQAVAGRDMREIEEAAELERRRARYIAKHYYRIDGMAAARVADALLECVALAARAPARPLRRALRSVAVHMARRSIGYSAAEGLSGVIAPARRKTALAAKAFRPERVNAVLARIDAAVGIAERVLATTPGAADLARPRLASGESLRIAA